MNELKEYEITLINGQSVLGIFNKEDYTKVVKLINEGVSNTATFNSKNGEKITFNTKYVVTIKSIEK